MTKAIQRVSRRLWRDSKLKAQRDIAILLLRFHSKRPSKDSPTYCNYVGIGEALGASPETVRKVCLKAVGVIEVEDSKKDSSKILESKHIRFLTSNLTLKRWVGRSLDERASLFTAKFADISGGALWHLYRKHGIKFKCVAVRKLVPKDKREQIK